MHDIFAACFSRVQPGLKFVSQVNRNLGWVCQFNPNKGMILHSRTWLVVECWTSFLQLEYATKGKTEDWVLQDYHNVGATQQSNTSELNCSHYDCDYKIGGSWWDNFVTDHINFSPLSAILLQIYQLIRFWTWFIRSWPTLVIPTWLFYIAITTNLRLKSLEYG